MAGQSVGIVSEIQSVKDILKDLIDVGIQEADRILGLVDICDD